MASTNRFFDRKRRVMHCQSVLVAIGILALLTGRLDLPVLELGHRSIPLSNAGSLFGAFLGGDASPRALQIKVALTF